MANIPNVPGEVCASATRSTLPPTPSAVGSLHRLLSFDSSLSPYHKMVVSHTGFVWKYFTILVAYAFSVL